MTVAHIFEFKFNRRLMEGIVNRSNAARTREPNRNDRRDNTGGSRGPPRETGPRAAAAALRGPRGGAGPSLRSPATEAPRTVASPVGAAALTSGMLPHKRVKNKRYSLKSIRYSFSFLSFQDSLMIYVHRKMQSFNIMRINKKLPITC